MVQRWGLPVSEGVPEGGQLVATPSAVVMATSSTPQNSGDSSLNARVLRVVDGDTVQVFYPNTAQGATTTVRLIGLDTPEVVDPRAPVQCFGREASKRAGELLPSGIAVKLETDPTQGIFDKYGRLLAYIYLPDTTLFNERMIEEGYGHEYTYKTVYQHQAEFKEAQQGAMSAGRGLWAPGVCQ